MEEKEASAFLSRIQKRLRSSLNLTSTFWAGGELEIGSSNTDDVTRATLERVGYIDLFARMRQYVPSELPHEDGGLMAGNLSFALIPRILNPNKGVKNDQLKVEKYAKRVIADNASFSLGHFAEHYVDYGPRGMWLSLLLFRSCVRTFNAVVSASESCARLRFDLFVLNAVIGFQLPG